MFHVIARPVVEPSSRLRYLPEKPCALGPSRFSWVAVRHGPREAFGSLQIHDLRTRASETHPLPGHPGFAIPASAHTFVIGCSRMLGTYDLQTHQWTTSFNGDAGDALPEGTEMNDAVLFRDALIFGTKSLDHTPSAGLYLWMADELTLLRGEQTVSNGKVVTTTGNATWLYDIDSPSRRVVRYRLDLDARRLTDARVIVDTSRFPGFPAGMIASPDERLLIVSFYDGEARDAGAAGHTRAFDTLTGGLVGEWRTPGSPRNTCACLVEHEGRMRLVITTAVEDMPAAQRRDTPHAGSIFLGDAPLPS